MNGDDKMNYRVPIPEDVKKAMNEQGRRIGASLPKGWGFALFLFTYGPNGVTAYISNVDRQDVLKALAEFLHTEGN